VGLGMGMVFGIYILAVDTKEKLLGISLSLPGI
jgi:hypothetical protein